MHVTSLHNNPEVDFSLLGITVGAAHFIIHSAYEKYILRQKKGENSWLFKKTKNDNNPTFTSDSRAFLFFFVVYSNGKQNSQIIGIDYVQEKL